MDSDLYVRLPVEKQALDRWMGLISRDTPIEFEIDTRLLNEGRAALMVAYLGPCEDPELSRIAAQLTNREPIDDSVLGRLTYNAEMESYETALLWGEREVELSIPLEEDGGIDCSLAHARVLWAARERWDAELRTRLVTDLLALKNDVWLEEDEAPVTAEQLLDRIVLNGVSMGESGDFQLWCDDGDLFWRHAVVVDGHIEGGLSEAALAG